MFNKREEDFDDLNRYNDYLEEVESITFNLINDVEVEETEKRIMAYLSSNKASIQTNVRNQEAESESQRVREGEDKAFKAERAKRRKERQERDKREKEDDERQLVEALAGQKGGDLQAVMQRRTENEQKREARREREEAEDEEEEKRRAITIGSFVPGKGKGGGVQKAGASRSVPYSAEMLFDFDGPLAALDRSSHLFDLKPAPPSLGGAAGKMVPTYDDPWITAELAKDDVARLRAGGYNWAQSWEREIRIAVEGIGLAPVAN